jgi:hypothetical protein
VLYSSLQCGLAWLAAERAITEVDGNRYHPNPQVSRKLVDALATTRW